MKKIITILIGFCFLTSSYAQLGIKGGINISNITTQEENIDDLHAKVGYQVGVMLDIEVVDFLSIRPEALYTAKGANYEFAGAEVETRMNYLDVPVSVVFRPLGLPISVHLGPQFSYLVSNKVTYKNGFLTTEVVEYNDRENFQNFDLGFVFGLAVEFDNSFAEIRYTKGLKEYEKSTDIGNLSIEPASKHFMIQASYGIFF